MRGARTIKSIDPVGYAGSIVAHPLPWALIAAVLGAGSTALLPALALAAAAVACRMALLRQVEHAYALPGGNPFPCPLSPPLPHGRGRELGY